MESTECLFDGMKDDIEKTISSDAMDVIKTILENVNKLSDIGKLLLYLKLPTGSFLHSLQTAPVDKDNTNNQVVNNWLKTHLKENEDAHLTKQELYEKYRAFACDHQFSVISMSDFGKAVRSVFPNVRDRRIGKRGGTKYVHHGIQYANVPPIYQMPDIPTVIPSSDVLMQQQQLGDSDRGSDSVDAAGMVVLEWAQKLCDQQFGSVSQLAEFLIQKQYVSSRSLHAFSVMTAAAIKSNSTISGLLPAADVNDSSVTMNDTHALLRKNVQERKAMVLMKDRMEEERRSVRLQNGTATTSGSPGACNCILSKALLSKSVVTSAIATPPKRILPKSASEDLDVLQKADAARVESVAPRSTTVRPSGGSPSARFMLMSPSNTSQVEQPPVIVLPSPIVSSRPVGPVVAAQAVLHKSQPSNRTILLVPTVDQVMRFPQLKPVPGSATIRNLSFAENGASADVASSGSNHAIVSSYQNALNSTFHLYQNAAGVTVAANHAVSVPGTRMAIASTLQNVKAISNIAAKLPNYVTKPVDQVSQSTVSLMAGPASAVVTAKSSSHMTSRSQLTHKSTATSSTSSSSSKTVMSLLRENNGRDFEWKAYMKDSRPVASLLKEERQKQQQQLQLALSAQLTPFPMQAVYQPVALCQPLPTNEQLAQFHSLNYDAEPLKLATVARRSSFERPCSVSDMLNLAALYTTASDVPPTDASSLTAGATRKRPHTALDESQALPDESVRAHSFDRTLNIDLIEKSALDDLLSDAGLLSTLPKSEQMKADDISVEFDLDIAEPPPAKMSLVNQSAENMTLQQLQQATLSRKSLREHCKQLQADSSDPPLFAGRPVSTLGEPLSSSEGLLARDSRPNTVAAFWEPAVYRGSSSSASSCDSQLPDFATAANTYSHFTPIQNLSEGVPSASDVVRPTAKVPASRLNDVVAEPGSDSPQAGTAGCDAMKRERGKQRRRFRHKSLSRSVTQTCSGEHLTVLSDCGAANFTVDRSDSPLSAEITDIIANDQRLHLGLTDFMGHALEETPSPYRSRSVPASVMLDFSLSDALAAEFTGDGPYDMLTGAADPSCNGSQLGTLRSLPVSGDVNFWDRPARGDHFISGVSFRPLPRNNGTVVRMMSESKETDTVDVVTHTPPSSTNASPNLESVFEPSRPETVAIAVDTPTSLESASVNDCFVEELLKEVCDNSTELLNWSCSS